MSGLIITPQEFDPAEFINQDWAVWRGPANGRGLKGKEDVDERSLALAAIDPNSLLFETCLEGSEDQIMGEEKLSCLKGRSDLIRLGGSVFLGLWRDWQVNGENGVLEHLYRELHRKNEAIYFDFMGLILRDPKGNRYVLYLHRQEDGWHWSLHWLNHICLAYCPSVVLAS